MTLKGRVHSLNAYMKSLISDLISHLKYHTKGMHNKGVDQKKFNSGLNQQNRKESISN